MSSGYWISSWRIPPTSGICGTDLHEYLEGPIFALTVEAPHPLTGESIPMTLGHEFAGVAAEVGEGLSTVRVGGRRALHRLPQLRCVQDRPLQRLPHPGLRRAVRLRRRFLAVRGG
jgi:threonine dehydrogenase-like Zn-dependent dehydrogenase